MLPRQLEEQPSGEPGMSEDQCCRGRPLHGIQQGTDSWVLLKSFRTVDFEACSSVGSQGIFVSMRGSERDVQLSHEQAIL